MSEDDPMRGTGRTTGLMLKVIGEALLAPGKWIEFKDHHDDCRENRFHASAIEDLAAGIGLQYFHVRIKPKDKTVWVLSAPPGVAHSDFPGAIQ